MQRVVAFGSNAVIGLAQMPFRMHISGQRAESGQLEYMDEISQFSDSSRNSDNKKGKYKIWHSKEKTYKQLLVSAGYQVASS